MTTTEWKPLRFRYDAAGRPPVIEAAAMTVQAYLEGQPCIGHDLPPRMGKSTLIHILGLELQAAGAPFVHVLTPWTNLARQLIDAKKISANLERIKAEGWNGTFCGQAVTALDSSNYWRRKGRAADPYTLITSTVHLANFNARPVVSAIGLAHEVAGKRPVIVVDEVHLLALGQKWAETLLSFQSAGAFVVTMTGTAERSDDACILGFISRPLSEWEEKNRKVITVRGEPYRRDVDGLLVRDVKGEERRYQQRERATEATGKTVPWSDAFSEGWMHLVGAQPQNFQVTVDGEPAWMDQVSKQTAKENLGRWMRSTECCRHLAVKGVEWLSLWRADKRKRHTKILAVTTSDLGNEKEFNAHAREMRRQLEAAISNDPLLARQDLCVEICTSVTETGDADEKAAEKLYRFGLTKTDDEGRIPIDVLIVKGMGLVGLDVPECKILLDASTFRTGPLKRQLATRPLTVWTLEDGTIAPEAQIAYPCDPANAEFYQSLTDTAAHGKEKLKESSTEFSDTVEVKPPAAPVDVIDGTGTNAGYQDEAGKWASGDHDRLIARIHATWPETLGLRRITLIEMYQSGAFPDEAMKKEEPPAADQKQSKRRVVDLSSELEKEKGGDGSETFGQKANRLASRIISYSENPSGWREIVKKLQSKAKRRCAVSPDEPVDRIQDPEILKALKKALDDVVVEVLAEL
jgi:hypothetical protein